MASGLMPRARWEVVLLPDNTVVPMRARLKRRVKEWCAHFGASSWAARVVRRGVSLLFHSAPTPYRCVQRRLGEPQDRAISDEIATMLECGVICRARPCKDSIISLTFCVIKKGTDKLRPCLDLRPLNRFLDPPKFWLDGLPVVRKLLRPGDWTCSLDLSSAYWHVPLA